jgi:hypothetical protein
VLGQCPSRSLAKKGAISFLPLIGTVTTKPGVAQVCTQSLWDQQDRLGLHHCEPLENGS